MQEVHTFRRLGVPDTSARTVWMFGFQRRRVRTCECDTLLPKPGPLPQTSQTEATAASIKVRIGRVVSASSGAAKTTPARTRGSLSRLPDALPMVRTKQPGRSQQAPPDHAEQR